MKPLYQLTLFAIGCAIGIALVWPVEAQDPVELEAVDRGEWGQFHPNVPAALPDSVPAIEAQKWWKTREIPPEQIWMVPVGQPWESGRTYADYLAELDSLILALHRIDQIPCTLPWAIGPPYCGITVGEER